MGGDLGLVHYAVLSLGTAGVYILIACGVVIVHRGTRVLNLAQGAMVMLSAFTFDRLRRDLSVLPAYVITVVVVLAVGALFATLVVRPVVARGSPLAQTVASLGLVVVLAELTLVMFGSEARVPQRAFLNRPLEIAGVGLGTDRLIVACSASAVAVLLWAGYRFTRAGLASSAAASSPRAAAALGWSPDRLAVGAWLLSSLVAGISGPIVAPVLGRLDPSAFILLVVPALAVAMVANFRSFLIVLVVAPLLATAELAVQLEIGGPSGWEGVDKLVPLVVILVVLWVRGGSLPDRRSRRERLPRLAVLGDHAPVAAIAVPFVIAGVWTAIPVSWLDPLTTQVSLAVVLLSLVVLLGYAGQISLGQMAIAGLAALVTTRLVATHPGLPLELAIAIGIGAAALAGIAFALPALRARGSTLAVVTLAMGVAANAILFQRAYYSPLPGGSAQPLDPLLGTLGNRLEGTRIGPQDLFGIPMDKLGHPEALATLSLVVFGLLTLVVGALRRSGSGRQMLAVRANERAAASLGVHVLATKVHAFVVAGCLAGIGGILLALGQGESVSFNRDFSPFGSIEAVAFVVVGGVGHIVGSMIGATFFPGALGPHMADELANWARDPGRLSPWVAGVAVGLLVRSCARSRSRGRLNRWSEIAVALVAGLFAALVLPPVLRRLDAEVGLAPWFAAAAIGGLGGLAAARALSMGFRSRWLAAAVAVACVVLVRVALAQQLDTWLDHLDTYVGLLAGLGLLATVRTSPDGIAAFLAHTGRGSPSGATFPTADHADLAPAIAPTRLEVRDLTVRFGPIVAVDGVSFVAEPGSVTGLIGPNGAGKSSLIDALSGFVPSAAERMALGTVDLRAAAPHVRSRAGLARTFQGLELFEELSVLENLAIGADERRARAYVTDLVAPGSIRFGPLAMAAIDRLGLASELARPVEELPHAQRRLVAVARALATEPSVLLLDEPAAGLDLAARLRLGGLIEDLRRWRVAVLVVEHDVDWVVRHCDRLLVLDFGRLIASGDPREVRADSAVQAAYLGDLDPEASA